MAKSKSKEPTFFGILFAAFLSVLLGLFLAVYTLVSRDPVSLDKALKPEEIKQHTVYFKKPSDRGRSNWRTARDWMAAGNRAGTLTLAEPDLNQWSRGALSAPAGKTPPPPPPAPAGDKKNPPAPQAPADADLFTFAVFPQETTFRFEENTLTIGAKLFFPPLKIMKGEDKMIQAQATGGFIKSEQTIQFRPRKLIIGSCPVPEQLIEPVYAYLLSRYEANKEYVDLNPTWKKLSGTTIENDTLVLTLPAPH